MPRHIAQSGGFECPPVFFYLSNAETAVVASGAKPDVMKLVVGEIGAIVATGAMRLSNEPNHAIFSFVGRAFLSPLA